MLPIILNPKYTSYALIGRGIASSRRLEMMLNHNATGFKVFTHNPNDDFMGAVESHKQDITFHNHLPSLEEIKGIEIIYVADFDDETSKELYKLCKQAGALVNVEDKIALCDFHVPSIIKRGDMLITASTGGKSPALARALRKDLSERYNDEWAVRLENLSRKRKRWKAQNLGIEKLAELSKAYMNKYEWF